MSSLFFPAVGSISLGMIYLTLLHLKFILRCASRRLLFATQDRTVLAFEIILRPAHRCFAPAMAQFKSHSIQPAIVWLTLFLCLAASWLQLRTRRTPSRKPTCHSAHSTNRNSQRDYARPAPFAAVDASVALISAEDSFVAEMSSAPVRFRMSFARFTSSEVSQCTETKIPPFCNRPSYRFASYSGMP